MLKILVKTIFPNAWRRTIKIDNSSSQLNINWGDKLDQSPKKFGWVASFLQGSDAVCPMSSPHE
jgi:hypothetical protein